MSVLASLFIAGCSQEEITPKGEDNGNGETTTSYLSINLISSGNSSRAAENYEDGTADENKVSSVRFYFFNGSGSAVNVKLKDDQYVNFYDWNPKTGDQENDKNDGDYIESVLQATIVINTASGDRIPQRIAAILNPSTSTLGEGSKSLDNLKQIYRDYAASNLTESGQFVMFNAVYAEGSTYFSTAPITSDNLCKSEDDAKKSPVTIKVERNVAKVKVTLDSSIGFNENNMLLLKDKAGKNILVNDEQVYLMLNGWDLTAEAEKTRLVKKINPSAGGGDWWNGGDRTFWAINAPEAGNSYNDYDAISNPFLTDNGTPKILYTNENAEDYSTTDVINRTKVIISGTLCDANKKPFTIARHLGAYYADSYNKDDETKNLTVLKTSILSQLLANDYHYYYAAEDNVRKPIEVSDLKIVIADQEDMENSKNNCYVYAQLTDDAAKKTWYNTDAQDASSIESTKINDTLKNKEVVDWALVWNEGKTYYFYEIKHTIGGPTLVGVVRNHIYDTHVTKIAGLGTPVYNPGEVIYPEIPDPNNHYIAAEIKILSWRIVKDEYALEW